MSKTADDQYVNSRRRALRKLAYDVAAYLIIPLMLVVVLNCCRGDLMSAFSLDEATVDEYVSLAYRIILMAFVAGLPLLLLGVAYRYFAVGSRAKLLCGILRTAISALWLILVVAYAATSFDVASMLDGSPVTSVTLHVTDLMLAIGLIMLVWIIVPIGEYLGGRKEYRRRLRERQNAEDQKSIWMS